MPSTSRLCDKAIRRVQELQAKLGATPKSEKSKRKPLLDQLNTAQKELDALKLQVGAEAESRKVKQMAAKTEGGSKAEECLRLAHHVADNILKTELERSLFWGKIRDVADFEKVKIRQRQRDRHRETQRALQQARTA